MHKITCRKRLSYRHKTFNGGWTSFDTFDRDATDSEIKELKEKGYTVIKHRKKGAPCTA